MQCECGNKLKAYKEKQWNINNVEQESSIIIFCNECNYYKQIPLDKAIELIPKGGYCYSDYHIEKGEEAKDFPTMVLDDLCPFWYRLEEMPSQAYGYCAYLLMGDWEEPMGLLWDQCKECHINEENDEED